MMKKMAISRTRALIPPVWILCSLLVFAMGGCEKKRSLGKKQEAESPVTDATAAEESPEDAGVAENMTGGEVEEKAEKKVAEPRKRMSQGLRIWDELMRFQCKGKQVGVWTPIQAMIAAHAPRAIGNGPITDARIKTFFEQDTAKYDGTHQGLLGLERDVARCMARMKGWEEYLRESTSWQLTEEVEGRLLQSPDAVSFINDVTLGQPSYPFGEVSSGVEVDGRIWLKATRKDCVSEVRSVAECLALEISCWSTGPCTGRVH